MAEGFWGGVREKFFHTQYDRVEGILRDKGIDKGTENEGGDYVYIELEEGAVSQQYLRGHEKKNSVLYSGPKSSEESKLRTRTGDDTIVDIVKLK